MKFNGIKISAYGLAILTLIAVSIFNDNQKSKFILNQPNENHAQIAFVKTQNKSDDKIKSFSVAGYALKTSLKEEEFIENIERLWTKFEDDFDYDLYNSRRSDKIYFVLHNYELSDNSSCELLIGFEVENLTTDIKGKFDVVNIPSTKYHIQTSEGNDYEDVLKAWEDISKLDLERKYSYDFEVYEVDEDFEVIKSSIYVSLK